jgi:prephenate dehydrogenase
MNIGIVGYGRFAQTLIRLFAEKNVFVLSRSPREQIIGVSFTTNPTEFYASVETVFYCVPISSFEQVLASHAPYITDQHVLIDVLSVKVHPQKVFERVLSGKKTQALLTHPMFGPDSSRDGFAGLPIILDKFRMSEAAYTFWKKRFVDSGLKVVEMSADEHDQMAARSQGVTHFIGRLLQVYGFESTPIDTLGAKKLGEIMDQVCNDTWELYMDLQHYNPYTKEQIKHLSDAFTRLRRK